MPSSQPLRRAAAAKKQQAAIRRRYHNPAKNRKMLPGEIPHVEDMVVILTLAGYSRIQTGQVVGISRMQVREILVRPHVTEKLVELRKRLPAAALELLENLMIEAVMTIAGIMRTSEDHKLVIQAAAEILDRGGLPKASRQERHTVNEDKTTITDDGILERLRDASPEVQEKAAQVIEQLEQMLSDALTENGKSGKKKNSAPSD